MGIAIKIKHLKTKKEGENKHTSYENGEIIIAQTNKETKNRIDQINRYKEEIGKLAQSITDELLQLKKEREKDTAREDSGAKTGRESKGGKRKKGQNEEVVELDYELANMNMIKKLLDISGNLENKRIHAKSKMLQKKLLLRLKKKKLEFDDETENGRRKIVVVEDDPTTINIISFVLSQHNYQVTASLNAEDGLKMVLKEKPDLIILDIMLPGMDGFQLLSILKENEETSHMPVVLISSLTGEKDILKGLEMGADDYILKPFSPQILYLKVKKIMSMKNENIAHHHRL